MANEMTLRIEIFPADLDEFVDFYVRVLRFQIDTDRRHTSDAPYAAVRRGATRIGALRAWRSVDPSVRALPQGVEIVLEVDDLEAEERAVLDAGWPVAEQISRRPWGLWDFRVLDPDGHYLRITTRA
jgi:predicted enzyme related to lactoylglutathione lyase